MNIIEWCNSNEGFINALLAIASLLLSFIAIVVSVQAIRLQYRKKLRIECGSFYGLGDLKGKKGIHITVTNISNVTITIKEISLKGTSSQRVLDLLDPQSEIDLSPGKTEVKYFEENQLKQCIQQLKLPIYAYAMDTSGKIYKKRITGLK